MLTLTNVSLALELSQNLLSIILLAKKDVKIFLRKADETSKMMINEEIFCLAHIIKN